MAGFQWGTDSMPVGEFQWGKDSTPEPKPKASMGQSFLAALARGATGGTLPYSVGQSGAEAEAIQKGATGPQDPESGMQMVPVESQDFLRNVRGALAEQKKTEEANPKSAFAGNVIGAIPATLAAGPFLGSALAASGMTSADMTQPTGPAQLAGETGLMFGLQAAAKPVIGVARKALGKFIDKGIAGIDETVARKAAEKATSETLTARAKAGNAASDYFRQVRDMGLTPDLLTQEQQAMYEEGKQALLQKASEAIGPAKAAKAAYAETLKQVAGTEGERAETYAADKLSGAEVLRQLRPRMGSYGIPAMVGGAIGQALGVPGGGLTGAGVGIAGRNLLRAARSPAAQRAGLSALQGIGSAAGATAEEVAPRAISRSAVRQLDPRLTALIEAQRRRQQGPQLAQTEGTQ